MTIVGVPLRILHIVPLASGDSAFGGPLSVAVAQARALRERGHEVTLVGGWRGEHPPPSSLEDVHAVLFPVRRGPPGTGFSGLTAPGLNGWWRGQSSKPDIVHLHSGRHLVTLLAGRAVTRSDVPIFVQTHGMLSLNRSPQGIVLDRLLTRPLLESARDVFSLTKEEDQTLREQFGGHLRIKRLGNGVEVPFEPHFEPRGATPELLFLGRLHERKRPIDLVRAARRLRDRGLTFRLAFVGPDEGQSREVNAEIIRLGMGDIASIEPPVAHSNVARRLSQATVFVLPSIDEPFPMTLLEALSIGTPAIATTGCGIADLLKEYDAAGVVEPNHVDLAEELESLLRNLPLRQERAANGWRLIRERLSMDLVAADLEAAYYAHD